MNMSNTLTQARKRWGDTNCGDGVARMLASLDIYDITLLADRLKNVPDGTHYAKYSHLLTASGTPNVGAMRMNAGNVIRAALRKATP